MGEGSPSLISMYRFLYAKKTLLMVSMVLLAAALGPIGFTHIFLPYAVMSVLTNLVEYRIPENSEDEEAFSFLSAFNPLLGIIISFILLGLAFAYPSYSMALRLVAGIAFFKIVKKTVEKYHISHGIHLSKERLFFYAASLVAGLIGAIFWDGILFLAAVLCFHLIDTAYLWNKYPFARPKMPESDAFRTLFENRRNFNFSILELLYRYIPAILFAFVDIAYFPVVFLGLTLSLFVYDNLTVKLMQVFKDRFSSMEPGELHVGLAHILEYATIVIMGWLVIMLPFAKEIGTALGFGQYAELLFIFLVYGSIRAIFRLMQLGFITKARIIRKIEIFEHLLGIALVLILGYTLGLAGIPIAFLVSAGIAALLDTKMAHKLMKQTLLTKEYFYVFLSALLSIAFVLLAKELLAADSLLSILPLMILGLGAYAGGILVLNMELSKRFVRFLFEKIGDAK
jgi:hypothetical protein